MTLEDPGGRAEVLTTAMHVLYLVVDYLTSKSPSQGQIVASVANIELFVVFMRPTEKFEGPLASEEGRRLLTDHLQYLFEIQRRGQLLGSGPLDVNVDRISGICVLYTPSLEDAERIAYAEPYHRAGWRTNTVRSWQLNEGLFIEAVKALADAV